MNVLFQGAGKSTFFIDGYTVYPFKDGDWGNILTDVVKSNRWILGENEDPNAKYPRLSYGGNNNNYQSSTYWMRNGSYLRLKNLEVGYTIPKSIIFVFTLWGLIWSLSPALSCGILNWEVATDRFIRYLKHIH